MNRSPPAPPFNNTPIATCWQTNAGHTPSFNLMTTWLTQPRMQIELFIPWRRWIRWSKKSQAEWLDRWKFKLKTRVQGQDRAKRKIDGVVSVVGSLARHRLCKWAWTNRGDFRVLNDSYRFNETSIIHELHVAFHFHISPVRFFRFFLFDVVLHCTHQSIFQWWISYGSINSKGNSRSLLLHSSVIDQLQSATTNQNW